MKAVTNAPPERLQGIITAFLSGIPSTAGRIAAVEAALRSPGGQLWRRELGRWATTVVPVEQLVPDAYRYWRPLVRDAMQFVVARLSASRLAPKIIEQMEAPPDMPPEVRLLRLISRVPGLQKIGQVLARNRHFDRRFRRALSQLENGIKDASIGDIQAIIRKELGPRMERYAVKLDSRIHSEASVSAVVRFTWRNPRTGRRERGVFKVLKPHIPDSFAEDMQILQKLAGFLARKYMAEGSRFAGVAESLTEVRRLLDHEVDFRREQRTLTSANRVYGSRRGVRVPRLIEALSTATITALTYEDGVKVTAALRGRPERRRRLAGRVAETLLAVPTLARPEEAMFHGDPHAGNLLYDERRDELVILDWALTERLSRDQRRRVAMLVLMTILRDSDGLCDAIEHLRIHRSAGDAAEAAAIRARIDAFLGAMPLFHLPGPMDALELLDEVARDGVRFPVPLIMFRKAAFTLDGVVEDIAGAVVEMDTVIAQYAVRHWASSGATLLSLLTPRDWIALQWSALTFGVRVVRDMLLRPVRSLSVLPEPQAIAAAPISG